MTDLSSCLDLSSIALIAMSTAASSCIQRPRSSRQPQHVTAARSRELSGLGCGLQQPEPHHRLFILAPFRLSGKRAEQPRLRLKHNPT